MPVLFTPECRYRFNGTAVLIYRNAGSESSGILKNWAKYNGTYRIDFNPDVVGLEYSAVFKQANNGRIKMQIHYCGTYYSPLYNSNRFTVKMNNSGKGTFKWRDSWGNRGIGVVRLKNEKLVLTLKEKYTISGNRASIAVTSLSISRVNRKTLFTPLYP